MKKTLNRNYTKFKTGILKELNTGYKSFPCLSIL